jgi:hypothetical protein
MVAESTIGAEDSREDFYALGSLSPDQFHDVWNGTSSPSAESRLAFAVLEQTLKDLDKYRHATADEPRRLYCQAEAWVQSNDRRWPYSFVNLCEILKVPSSRLRIFVLSTKGDPLKEPAAEDTPAPFAGHA